MFPKLRTKGLPQNKKPLLFLFDGIQRKEKMGKLVEKPLGFPVKDLQVC